MENPKDNVVFAILDIAYSGMKVIIEIKGSNMGKKELEDKLQKQCTRLCKVTNEFNRLRADIELTKKQLAEAKE